jgi:hypothetical protein
MQQVGDHLGGRFVGERRQVQPRRRRSLTPLGALVEELAARRGQQQDRRVRRGVENVLEHVQERMLGPVDVVDQGDHRAGRGQALEELAGAPVQFGQREAGRAQADRAGQAVGDVGVDDRRQDAGTGAFRRVFFKNACCAPDQADQRPVGDAVAVGKAATTKDASVAGNPIGQCPHQVRLSQPGVADHGDELNGPALACLPIRGAQAGQFVIATHDGSVLAPCVTVQAACGQKTKGRDLLGLALELQRLDRFDLHRVPGQPVGRLADVDLVDRRRLLQTCGDVDGVTSGQLLVGRRVVVGDHLAGVHTGSVGQRDAIVSREVLVDLCECRPHVDHGAYRAQRIVLVRARQPEDGHDGVPDELFDLAAVAQDLRGHRVEVAGLDLVQALRIQSLAQRCGVLQVAKDHRDRLAQFAHRQRRRHGHQGHAAVSAKPEFRWVFFAATGTLDHRPEFTGLAFGAPCPRSAEPRWRAHPAGGLARGGGGRRRHRCDSAIFRTGIFP